MAKPSQFSDRDGSNIAGKITAFYKGLTRICTPEQEGDANHKIV